MSKKKPEGDPAPEQEAQRALRARLAAAGDRRDWDAVNDLEARLEGDVTESPKNTAGAVRSDAEEVARQLAKHEALVREAEMRQRLAEAEAKFLAGDGPDLKSASCGVLGGAADFGDPLPPHAPMPRGPFVRYHDVNERAYLAVVTAVHDDGSINCHVFPDGPRSVHMIRVAHGYDQGCWEDYL